MTRRCRAPLSLRRLSSWPSPCRRVRRRRRIGLPDDGRLGHDALGAPAGLSSHAHARPHLHLAGGRRGRGRGPVRAPQPAVRGRHVHVRPHVRPLQLRQREGAGLSVRAHLARVPAAIPRAAAAQLAALPPAADLPRLLLQIDRRQRTANRKRPHFRSRPLLLLPAFSAVAAAAAGGCAGLEEAANATPCMRRGPSAGSRCRRRPRGGGTSIVPPRLMMRRPPAPPPLRPPPATAETATALLEAPCGKWQLQLAFPMCK